MKGATEKALSGLVHRTGQRNKSSPQDIVFLRLL